MARVAEQQRMMEERQKAMAENAKKSKMELEWVEQQNTAYLVEEDEHLASLAVVASSVDQCEEFISKTEEVIFFKMMRLGCDMVFFPFFAVETICWLQQTS